MSLDESQLAMINTLIYQEDFGSAYKQCVRDREARGGSVRPLRQPWGSFSNT